MSCSHSCILNVLLISNVYYYLETYPGKMHIEVNGGFASMSSEESE